MQCWINGPAGGIDDKIKMANILLKTNIPSFHHSIIPFPEQIRKPQKISTFSVGCRNSEALIIGTIRNKKRFNLRYNCCFICFFSGRQLPHQ